MEKLATSALRAIHFAVRCSVSGTASEIETSASGQAITVGLPDNVIVGSSAQILGPITVGECARIGANTVVLKDVPANATMVGNPAKNISTNTDTSFKPYGVRDINDNK